MPKLPPMSELSPLKQILAATGVYTGEGINHQNQKFQAEFSIEPVLAGRAARIHYRAKGFDGSLYHEEVSTIAPTWDEKLILNNLNTNMPGTTAHVFTRRQAELGAKEGFVFNFNDPTDVRVFREEICLSLYANGDLGYRYSWGMPGSDFGFRSSVRLKRV